MIPSEERWGIPAISILPGNRCANRCVPEGVRIVIPFMTPDQIETAARRLRLGVANVGFWVLAAGGGLGWVSTCGGKSLDPRLYAVAGIAAVGAQAIFDFLGGIWSMPRPRQTLTGFLARWLRGVLGHTLVPIAVGLLSFVSFIYSSGFSWSVLLASLGLAIGRIHLLRIIGGASFSEIPIHGETVLVAEVEDPAFTGGVVGFGRRAFSLFPARWRDCLSETELAVESFRRNWQISQGLSARAFVLILGWNLLGVSIGSTAFKFATLPPGVALFGHACWMTLWTFASLLLLPVLSGQVVFAADRAAADAGHDPSAWIARFPGLIGEDGNPSIALQTIFYPLPSATLRLRALRIPAPRFVPGNLARSNLYYSCAAFTLLGRAVHCNIGRPALWIFAPSA